MNEFFAALRRIWAADDLRNRILITIFILVIYRLAAHIPVPGINVDAVRAFFETGAGAGNNFINILDLLSGGTVSNMSVLAMGVYPYITAQIILQLLTPIIPRLQRMMEEDPTRFREFQERWTYYLAVPMAALNAFGQIQIIRSLQPSTSEPILTFGELGFNLPTITMIIAMTAGTMFAIWLGELISEYGLKKQGLSLIIFAGIVARVPTNLASILQDETTRIQALVTFLILLVLMVVVIVVVQQGRRNVPVMYPGRRMGNQMSMPVRGQLPLQVNMAGMIPIIFAQSILTFPAIIAQFFVNSTTQWVADGARTVSNLFGGQSEWYWLLYFIFVVLFAFFYTNVLFTQQNYGENLKRAGAQIPGITKGAPTQKYLEKVLSRITLPGALFLGLIAVLPFLIQATGLIPNAANLSILSTGLLIVVGVVRDTFFGLDAELKLRGYNDSLLVK